MLYPRTMLHPTELYYTFITMLHPTELYCTFWDTLHHAKQNCNLLSYTSLSQIPCILLNHAARDRVYSSELLSTFQTVVHPTELDGTLMSCSLYLAEILGCNQGELPPFVHFLNSSLPNCLALSVWYQNGKKCSCQNKPGSKIRWPSPVQ